jgi:hypothetical protein
MRSNNQKKRKKEKKNALILRIYEKKTRLCCFNINIKLTIGDDVYRIYIVFTFVGLINELE